MAQGWLGCTSPPFSLPPHPSPSVAFSLRTFWGPDVAPRLPCAPRTASAAEGGGGRSISLSIRGRCLLQPPRCSSVVTSRSRSTPGTRHCPKCVQLPIMSQIKEMLLGIATKELSARKKAGASGRPLQGLLQPTKAKQSMLGRTGILSSMEPVTWVV